MAILKGQTWQLNFKHGLLRRHHSLPSVAKIMSLWSQITRLGQIRGTLRPEPSMPTNRVVTLEVA